MIGDRKIGCLRATFQIQEAWAVDFTSNSKESPLMVVNRSGEVKLFLIPYLIPTRATVL